MSTTPQHPTHLPAALLCALRHFVTVRAEYDIAAEAHLEAVAAAQHSAERERAADLYLAKCETAESQAFESLAKALQAFDARNLGLIPHADRFPIAEQLVNLGQQMAACARAGDRRRATHLTLVTEATVGSLPGAA